MQKPTFLPSEKEKKEKRTGVSWHYPGHWILFLGLGSQLLTLQVGISLACWQLWLSNPSLGTAALQKDTDKLKNKSRKSSYNPNAQSVVLLSSVRPARASNIIPQTAGPVFDSDTLWTQTKAIDSPDSNALSTWCLKEDRPTKLPTLGLNLYLPLLEITEEEKYGNCLLTWTQFIKQNMW